MPHATGLISIIALGMVSAFVGGMLAQRLRLPPLVGYLVAGIAIGPFTPGFVGDPELASQLAELGVILLMFGVGLHFSIADLMAVRTIALPGAIVQIAVATAMGAGLAWAFGWSAGAGLVFGLALSVASTVVLLPALAPSLGGEAAGGGAHHGAPVQNLWLSLGLTLAKVSVFVAIMLVGGRRVVPYLMGLAARTGSRELFTLAVLASAVGIAYASSELFGVSFALGAFFAGMVLSESDLSHQAAADSLPLQDAFAVLFFVSVGMLFDPGIVLREPLAILGVVGVIVLGKSLAAIAIVLAFGHPVGTALTIAASLAQIGEFSFILASLGISLKLLPESGRDLILGGALLSITLNPLFFALADRVSLYLGERPEWRRRLERRAAAPLPLSTSGEGMRDHAVIVGYGRVGSAIGKALHDWKLPFVVVERDRRRVEDLRAQGVPAVFGDASAPGILEAADIGSARLVVLATPDSHQGRRLLAKARAANPGIDSVVRTHSEAERRRLEEDGVGLVLMAERELALGMMTYALRSLGVREGEVRLFVDSSRSENQIAAAPPAGQSVPELRQRRDEPEV